MQQLGEQQGVVEGDGHTATGEGVPHVQGVAEDDEAARGLGNGREPAVGHAAGDLAIGKGLFGSRADGLGEHGDSAVLDVAADAAGFGRSLGDVCGHVEERSCLVSADLVEENRKGVADDDMAVEGQR